MGLARPFPDDFWISKKVNEDYSLDEKLVYVYLATNSHTQQLGIYSITKKLISFELNMDIERVKKALFNLENKHNVIKYSEETGEVAILDYYRYGLIKGGKPLENCFNNLEKKVHDYDLLRELYNYSKDIKDSREVYSTVMEKLKTQLQSMNLLDEEDDSSTVSEYDNYYKNMYPEEECPF